MLGVYITFLLIFAEHCLCVPRAIESIKWVNNEWWAQNIYINFHIILYYKYMRSNSTLLLFNLSLFFSYSFFFSSSFMCEKQRSFCRQKTNFWWNFFLFFFFIVLLLGMEWKLWCAYEISVESQKQNNMGCDSEWVRTKENDG